MPVRRFHFCFLLCIISCKTRPATCEKSLVPYEYRGNCLSRNISRIWRTVDPKVTTIILDEDVDGRTYLDTCQELVSDGATNTMTLDRLERSLVPVRKRYYTKMMIIYIHVGKECPTPEESQKLLARWQEQYWWFHRVRIMYLLATTSACNDVKFIYKQFWQLRVFEVSIVTFDPLDSCNLTLRQCNPFTNLCGNTPNPSFTEPFSKYITDMKGFPLLQSAIHRPPNVHLIRDEMTGLPITLKGIDLDVMEFFAEKLNATRRIIPRFDEIWGTLDTDDFSGVFSDLRTKRADMLSNSVFTNTFYAVNDHVETTVYYEYNKLCAVVPVHYRIRIYQFTSFVLILALAGVSVGIVWMTSLVLNLQSEIGPAIQIYGILIGGKLLHTPRRFSPRIILISWMLSALVLSTIFQTCLTKALMIDEEEVKIRTLAELDGSGLIPVVSPSFVDMIFGGSWDDPIFARLKQRSKSYRASSANCFEKLLGSSKGNVTCIVEESVGKVFMKRTMHNNLPIFGIADECLFEQYKGFLVRRGSPYLPSLNRLLLRMHDHGIMAKMKSDAVRSTALKPSISADDVNKSALSWDHLRHTLFILAFGFAIATLTFFGELIFHSTRKDEVVQLSR